jgi:tRNA(Leu) C34 or U34 (ribose-2'-O)-methylase TrmL
MLTVPTKPTYRGYSGIGLHLPKNNSNIGSVLRAAGNFGVSMVAVSGKRYSKAPTDTMKQYRHTPLFQVNDLHDLVPYACVPVAVDIIDGAIDLTKYTHPERAFYIFGPEDGTLGREIIDWCRDVVYVPTNRCMNLAGTVHVVLYDRLAKMIEAAGR